jgi:hypothetical protein
MPIISKERLVELRAILDPRTPEATIKGAEYIINHLVVKRAKRYDVTLAFSQWTILNYTNFLLSKNAYAEAATLLWGKELFTVEPASVRMIWEELPKNCEVAIMGAGSTGKTYSVGVWLLLDWIRDPEYTCIKVLSVTQEHAKRNVFAQMKNLHRNAIVPLPGIAQERSIQVGSDDKQGIHLVPIPAGDDGKGRLRGFHPVPRGTIHPQFGSLTRIRVILDEAEEIPQGVWEDVDNILGNKDGVETIKVIAASNPKDVNSKFGQLCEPVGGWDGENMDFSERWSSRLGWRTLHIDGSKCENVIEKKLIYPGLLTWEGYSKYLLLPEGSPSYYCADLATEVLSKRGWLKGTEVLIGDEIYTVNINTGIAEWQPVQEVFCKSYEGEMVRMKNRHLDAFVTPNHKWAITHRDRMRRKSSEKRSRLTLKETAFLRSGDMIPLIRSPEDSKSKYSEDFAELIGWIVTDGTFSKKWNRITIYQSSRVNGHKCKMIRDLLVRLELNFQENIYGKDGIIHFGFSGDLAKAVRKVIPVKKLTMDFIESLNHKSRLALLKSIILGDGGIQGGSTPYVCTSNEGQAGIYQALMARCGFASRIHKRNLKTKINGLSYESVMYYVDQINVKHVRSQYIEKTREQYSGIVWCPRTVNGTFFARRNGCTYFTGNTMARGWFPIKGLHATVFPLDLINRLKGEFIFTGRTVFCAASDLAFEGDDKATFAVGRCGMAIGWTPPGKASVLFTQQKFVLQIEQIISMAKKRSLEMTHDIIAKCEMFNIKPRWFICDRTGNGTGVHDNLVTLFGPETMGLHYGDGATETKILEDELEKACDNYDGVVTELFFALRKWAEFDHVKIVPSICTPELTHEFTDRRYKQGKLKKVRIESKRDYKDRNGGVSPDEADSITMLLHLVRIRGEFSARMLDQVEDARTPEDRTGYVDKLQFITFDD